MEEPPRANPVRSGRHHVHQDRHARPQDRDGDEDDRADAHEPEADHGHAHDAAADERHAQRAGQAGLRGLGGADVRRRCNAHADEAGERGAAGPQGEGKALEAEAAPVHGGKEPAGHDDEGDQGAILAAQERHGALRDVAADAAEDLRPRRLAVDPPGPRKRVEERNEPARKHGREAHIECPCA